MNQTNEKQLIDLNDIIVNNGQGIMWELKVIRFDWSNFYKELQVVLIDGDGNEQYMLESNLVRSIERGMYLLNP